MQINFIFQINQFNRIKREKPISANAQALWLELFGLFNSSRFPDEIPVSTTRLASVLNLSKDTVLRARKELEEKGYIEVARNDGRKASTVRMNYFTDCGEPVDKSDNIPVCDANTDATCDANIDANTDEKKVSHISTQKTFCVANIDTNINLNKNVYEDDDEEASRIARAREEAQKHMRKAFGRDATEGEKALLYSAVCRAESATNQDCTELIGAALDIAGEYGAGNPAQYACTVLREWQKEYITRADEARRYAQNKRITESKSSTEEAIEASYEELAALRQSCFTRYAQTLRKWREQT